MTCIKWIREESLHAHLTNHLRIQELFEQSNLFKDVTKRVIDCSLYLPPTGYSIQSCHVCRSTGLCMGYMSQFHRLGLLVYMEGYNEDTDEHEEISRSITIDIPITLVDGYTIKTEKYGHPSNNLTHEVMTFVYPKKAFNQWAANRRDAIRLIKERDELNKQIKALGYPV